MQESPQNGNGTQAEKQRWRQFWDWINVTGFWALLTLGAVLVVVVIVFAFSTNDNAVRATILAAGIPAVLTFVAVMIQAATSKQAVEIMDRQETETTKQRIAADEANARTDQIIAQGASQLLAMQDQITHMIGQTETMQGQLTVMQKSQESFVVAERAYLTIKRLSLANKPFEKGKTPTIVFRVFNGGKTPAFNVTCRNGTMITHKPLVEVEKEMIDRLGTPMTATYLVGGDSIMATMKTAVQFPDDVSILGWKAGALRYYWVAQLRYDYIDDRQETMKFWFEFIPHPELFGVWTMRRVGDFLTFHGEILTYHGEAITFTPDARDFPDTYSNEDKETQGDEAN